VSSIHIQCILDYPSVIYQLCGLSVHFRKLLMINDECGKYRDLMPSVRIILETKKLRIFYVNNKRLLVNYACIVQIKKIQFYLVVRGPIRNMFWVIHVS